MNETGLMKIKLVKKETPGLEITGADTSSFCNTDNIVVEGGISSSKQAISTTFSDTPTKVLQSVPAMRPVRLDIRPVDEAKNPDMLDAALAWARNIGPVFPCRNGGKTPLTAHAFKDASRDPEVIREFWSQTPDANIGMATGEVSGIVVVDLDFDLEKGKNGIAVFTELAAEHGGAPNTMTVRSPRGGLHLYFKKGLREIPSNAGKVGKDIDVRGDGGYIIVPPSMVNDRRYTIEFDRPPCDLPDWLMALVEKDPNRKPAPVRKSPADPGEADKIRDALKFISPDCTYDDWRDIGMALHNWDPEAGFEIWNSWSSGSKSKYEFGECEHKWNSFREGGGITIASLFGLALKAGWSRRAPAFPGKTPEPITSDTVERLKPTGDTKSPGDLIPAVQAEDPIPCSTLGQDITGLVPQTVPAGLGKAAPQGNGSDSAALQAKLFKIVMERGLTTAERRQRMAWAVLDALHDRGRLFHHAVYRDHGTAMYFDSKTKALLLLAGDRFQSWLAGFMGINRTDPNFAFIFAAIEDDALTGTGTGLVPELFWASRPDAVYLSSGDGQMVKISAAGVTLVDNGTDNVLFADGATLASWTLTDPVDPFTTCALWRDMKTAADHGRDLLRLWTTLLPLNLVCKPPLALSGGIGSGKTQAARGLYTLFGLPERIVKILETGEGDFWTALDAGGLACFDNADTKIKWLPDALAAAATGGSHYKRKLYKDGTGPGETVQQIARAGVILTSASPTFASDAGLADRLLVIRMNRREVGETAETALHNEIARNRNAGLSWIAQTLAKALADTGSVPKGLNRRHPDFATWGVRIGRAMGKEAEAVKALQAAENDKGLFCLENDDLGAALIGLLATNSTFSGTATALRDKLRESDPSFEETFWTPRRISKRLTKIWPHLEAVFQAKVATAQGGFMSYRFARKGDYGDFPDPFSGKPRVENFNKDFTQNSPLIVTIVTQDAPSIPKFETAATPHHTTVRVITPLEKGGISPEVAGLTAAFCGKDEPLIPAPEKKRDIVISSGNRLDFLYDIETYARGVRCWSPTVGCIGTSVGLNSVIEEAPVERPAHVPEKTPGYVPIEKPVHAPRLVFGAVYGNESGGWIIPAENMPTFLEAHNKSTLAVYDGPFNRNVILKACGIDLDKWAE